MKKVTVFLTSLLIAKLGTAHELTTTIGANAEYSDNILQQDLRNPKDDLLSTTFLGVDYKYEFSSVLANVNYTARKLNYRDDSFDNRTDFLGTANIDWQIIPKRFSWNFSHSRDRVLTDRKLVETPANEQDRMILRSGPQFQINFGRDASLLISGSYVVNQTEQSSRFKSTQVQSQARFLRPLGQYKMELSVSSSNVNYGDSSLDYTSERYSFGINGAGSVVSWNADIGQNTIERVTRGSSSGLFYSAGLNFSRNDLSIGIRTNRELTDSQIGLSLNENILDPLNNSDGNVGAFDIVERTRYEFTVTQAFQRLSATYSVTKDLQDFQSLAQDESSLLHSLFFNYPQTDNLSWNLRFSRQSSTFQVPGIEDTRFVLYDRRLTLRMKLNSKLNVNAWISTRRRSVDAGSTQSFKEEGLGIEMTLRI